MPSVQPPWLGTLLNPWHRWKRNTVTRPNRTLPLFRVSVVFFRMGKTERREGVKIRTTVVIFLKKFDFEAVNNSDKSEHWWDNNDNNYWFDDNFTCNNTGNINFLQEYKVWKGPVLHNHVCFPLYLKFHGWNIYGLKITQDDCAQFEKCLFWAKTLQVSNKVTPFCRQFSP